MATDVDRKGTDMWDAIAQNDRPSGRCGICGRPSDAYSGVGDCGNHGGPTSERRTRYALISPMVRPSADVRPEDVARELERVRAYLPRDYSADIQTYSDGGTVLIYGRDSAGWTLDGYVIPRLASGLIFAREIDSADTY